MDHKKQHNKADHNEEENNGNNSSEAEQQLSDLLEIESNIQSSSAKLKVVIERTIQNIISKS